MVTKVVTIAGVERLAQVAMGDISHVAVGTGTTVPSGSDTQLVTETARKVATNTFRQGQKFQVRAFFTNAELPTTTEEVGVFMNGTGAADSGELLIRALLTFTKASSDLALIFELELEEVN
tara:strand:+ start:980 stop:1342 length:363 start_codon:yes stop_codon:yes gene_type:complete